MPDFLQVRQAFFVDCWFDGALSGWFVWASIRVFRLELAKVLTSRASSSADVSDSRWVCSFDDSDTKLWVDDSKSECSASNILPFAAVISFSRCSFAQPLAFLKWPVPCRKVSGQSVIANDLSLVIRYSVGFVGFLDGVVWVVYMVRRPLWYVEVIVYALLSQAVSGLTYDRSSCIPLAPKAPSYTACSLHTVAFPFGPFPSVKKLRTHGAAVFVDGTM